MVDNGLTDDFQSAYKCGHSTETALLRVYNDIVVTIGKGNGNFLVLLDLSSAFDTIGHSNLFTVLGKHVGICDDALNLIVSYLSDRKQQVRIDNIMSDLASIICGVPQGSVMGPLKFCLYLLPLCSILKRHNIGYHISILTKGSTCRKNKKLRFFLILIEQVMTNLLKKKLAFQHKYLRSYGRFTNYIILLIMLNIYIMIKKKLFIV